MVYTEVPWKQKIQKDILCKHRQNKGGMAILTSHKVDFKARNSIQIWRGTFPNDKIGQEKYVITPTL